MTLFPKHLSSAFGLIALAGILATSVAGCSMRQVSARTAAGLLETGVAAYEQDDDLELLRQAFPSNIKVMEALLANDPDNLALLVLLGRAYGSYAFAFVDGRTEAAQLGVFSSLEGREPAENLRDRAAGLYRKGMDYSLRALEIRHPDSGRQLQHVASTGAFFQSLDAKDVPALFWYGFNLSGWINHNRDSVRAISRAHLVETSMQRVLQLEPDYFHGGARLVLMVYYASRSPMMGGNPQLALEQYRQLQQRHGRNFLLKELLYARYVLVQRRHRDQFEAVLKRLAFASHPRKEYRLYDRIAMDRAALYLEATGTLFE